MSQGAVSALRPVPCQRLPGSRFEQIRIQTLRGERASDSSLPAVFALGDSLGGNHVALREALQGLEQAGFLVVRQGDASRVQPRHASYQRLRSRSRRPHCNDECDCSIAATWAADGPLRTAQPLAEAPISATAPNLDPSARDAA